MTPERWQRIQEVFGEAVELPTGPAREAFLDRACAGDAELHARIAGMLELDEDASSALDATPLELADAVRPLASERYAHQAVGPYRIVREIGRGGMGTVYLAEREDVGKRVALKLVRDGLAAPGNLERFLRERRVLARLEHPNIALLLDAGTSQDGTPYFAMEYVQGQPIDRYCDEHRLPIEARLALFEEVCEAVEYAHRQGIVHRDLKPSNILVQLREQGTGNREQRGAEERGARSEERVEGGSNPQSAIRNPQSGGAAGTVKLLDFGIAKLLAGEEDARAGMTRTGARLMTPEFAAPEQIRGEEIRPSTDVYSLGILLYRLLTGGSPYRPRSGTLGELERVVIEQEPPRPSTFITGRKPATADGSGAEPITAETVSANRSTVPQRLRRQLTGDLDSIVLKALEKAPERRYGSAGELLEDLRRYRTGSPVRARSATVRYRAWKWMARNRVAAAVASAVFLGTGAGAWWASSPEDLVLSATSVVVLPFEFRGGEDHAYLREGMVSLLSAGINTGDEVRAVDSRALFNYLDRSDTAEGTSPQAVARHFGAAWYVRGVVAGEGPRVRITASLYHLDRRGRARQRGEMRVEGAADSLVVLLDRLTGQFLDLWGGRPSSRLMHSAALSTRSVPAMRLYLEGEEAMRSGAYAKALESFQRAALEDSTFALAHLRLSIAATWSDPRLALPASTSAVRWSPGLPRLDSLLIQAWHQHQSGDPAEAERLYRAVLHARPDDVEAWYQLAEVLYHWGPMIGRPPTESWEAFEHVLRYEPDNLSALVHLARLAAREGRLDVLDTLSARALRLEPQARQAQEFRALRAFSLGDHEELAALQRELATGADADVLMLVRTLATSLANPAQLEPLVALLRTAYRRRTVRDGGELLHAQILAGGGRIDAAAAELAAHREPDQGWAPEYRAVLASLPFIPTVEPSVRTLRAQTARLPSRPSAVTDYGVVTMYELQIYPPHRQFLLGMLDLRLGEPATALTRAERLDALSEQGYVDASGMATVLRAAVLHARGEARQALATLGPPRVNPDRQFPVLLSYPKAFERWLRAELLRELGRDDEALRWYATFPDPAVHDLVFVAPSHLRRAEIHERRGEREAAVGHYRRFLELWEGADPALQPLVEQAQERLARLGQGRESP